MTEIAVDWITGLSVGLEFPPVKDIDEDLKFAMNIDLFIFRVVFLIWKRED